MIKEDAVIQYLEQKGSEGYIHIGNEPKHIKPSRNTGLNNLEEQLILGGNTIVSETNTITNEGNLQTVETTIFGLDSDNERRYKLVKTTVTEQPINNKTHTLFINNLKKVSQVEQLSYELKGGTSIPVAEKVYIDPNNGKDQYVIHNQLA